MRIIAVMTKETMFVLEKMVITLIKYSYVGDKDNLIY